MSEFIEFLKRMAIACQVQLPASILSGENEYEVAARILHEINSFLYVKGSGVPGEYMSEFHQYWEGNCENILNPTINPHGESMKVAVILERVFQHGPIRVQFNTMGLEKEQIALVRFFTAIQDFNIDLGRSINPFELFVTHPDCFTPAKIVENELLVDTFLTSIGAESQRDKRKKWMIDAAKFLIERYQGEAYTICGANQGDVLKIVHALSVDESNGFSTKKIHMFLRDMADLGVWTFTSNYEMLDVMSDKNTMRVALRTGILQFRIPLLASYLDVHCEQYELVDQKCREAWRSVWSVWGTIPDNHRPPTPASMDYLIYRLGKLACRKSTRVCTPSKPIDYKKKNSLIPQDRLAFGSDNYCIFNSVCPFERRILNAPNSISIMGMTGWKNGKTNSGGGGGISS